MCQGDIAANLTAFKAGPRPKDDVATKSWLLLKERAVEDLVPALKLLAEVSFSTIAVEEGHGPLAASHRKHPLMIVAHNLVVFSNPHISHMICELSCRGHSVGEFGFGVGDFVNGKVLGVLSQTS